MRFEVIHPEELGPAQAAQWHGLRGSDPNLGSPYLTPEWAKLVGALRPDARVCVVNDGEGFLGVQRSSRFAAMGLGAPVADYQGLVAKPGLELDGAALCRALKVGRLDLASVPTGQTLFTPQGADGSWIAEISDGPDAYRAALRERRSKFVRELDKKHRRLAEEAGEVEFTALSANTDHFTQLLAWKHAQLRRTGQPPIWSTPWVRALLDQCFAAKGPHFGGVLFTLTAGGKLVAANFCLRSERVLHGWIIAHDGAYERNSPGVLLARWAIEWAASQGYAEVDFGPGDYQFKRQLSTSQRMVEWGAVSGVSWSGAVRKAQFALRAGLEKLPDQRLAALPGKAMRRLDVMRALAA